jgi:ATP-dependent 26S proteasome regulatory subunit
MTNTDISEQLDIYLRARVTLIVLVTPEEERAVQVIREVANRTHRGCLTWDIADGFSALSQMKEKLPTSRDPMAALTEMGKIEGDAVVILKDFHECWKNSQIKRKLRNLAQRLKFTKTSLLVITPCGDIPDELKDEAVFMEFPSPVIDELESVLDKLVQTPGVQLKLTDAGREKLLQAALGMTASQAQRVFAKAIVKDGKLDDRDIQMVTDEKKQIIGSSEALEFFAVTETPDDVGGLGVLKEWLRMRERAFTKEARDYGLPAPKGVSLIGIPGTGKSLTAKMVGGLWRLPLLRLDVGALFGSLVGESEERARRALRVAETIAPCVLWIDEMEKALAHGGSDSGTSVRVFGTILTWMQEKTSACFVVATANDITSLPPELLRKGRFDEIFFLDLPTLEERQEIFAVHLRKRHRLPGDFNVAALAAQSEGYVGAEIEQAVIDAMYIGFDEDREFTTDDIACALSKQVPLSISQREQIEYLRGWLQEGRARSASFQETREAEEQFVPLQLRQE